MLHRKSDIYVTLCVDVCSYVVLCVDVSVLIGIDKILDYGTPPFFRADTALEA